MRGEINQASIPSFKETFEQMFPSVCLFVNSYIQDIDTAKDLTQDVFFKVYENWNKFSEIASYKAYIYTSAKNIALDHIKHQKVVSKFKLANNDIHSEEYFLHELTKQETIRSVYHAVDKLPLQSKNIILLSLKGLTNDDIASSLAISVNTVKTLKKLAYSKLRQHLSYEEALILLAIFFN